MSDKGNNNIFEWVTLKKPVFWPKQYCTDWCILIRYGQNSGGRPLFYKMADMKFDEGQMQITLLYSNNSS